MLLNSAKCIILKQRRIKKRRSNHEKRNSPSPIKILMNNISLNEINKKILLDDFNNW